MEKSEREELKNKILEEYGDIMSEDYTEIFLDDLEAVLDQETELGRAYRRSVKGWLRGRNGMDDTLLPAVDEEQTWSLREIAGKLNETVPNIPAAVLLLDYYDSCRNVMSMILSVAEEECFCDEKILLEDEPECAFAYLDIDTEQWFFTCRDTETCRMRKCQLWQVLTAVPELAEIVSYDYKLGTGVILENGEYTVYEMAFPDEASEDTGEE